MIEGRPTRLSAMRELSRGWFNAWTVAAAAAVLAGLTALLMLPGVRFETVGGELLRNPGFADGGADWRAPWQATGLALRGGTVVFRADEAVPILVQQVVPRPAGADFVRLSFDARYVDIRGPTKSWHRALVSVVQRNAAGRELWEYPHQAMQRLGSRDWFSHQEEFYLPADTTALRIVFGLNWVAGEMSLRNLSLVPVRERPYFRVLRGVVIVAWLMLGLAALRLEIRRRRWYRHAIVAAVAAAILAGTLLPHKVKSELIEAGRSIANELRKQTQSSPGAAPTAAQPAQPPAPSETADNDVRIGEIWALLHHSGHITLYLLLSWTACWAWWRKPHWQVLGLLLGFAAVTEVLQSLTLDRHPDAGDMLRNATGVMLGWLAALATARLRAWRGLT